MVTQTVIATSHLWAASITVLLLPYPKKWCPPTTHTQPPSSKCWVIPFIVKVRALQNVGTKPLFFLVSQYFSLTDHDLSNLFLAILFLQSLFYLMSLNFCLFLIGQASTNLPHLTLKSPSTRTPAPPSTAWGTSSARTSTGRTCAWWADLYNLMFDSSWCHVFWQDHSILLEFLDSNEIISFAGCFASCQCYFEEPEACCHQKEAHQGCEDSINWFTWQINKNLLFGQTTLCLNSLM